MNAGLLRSAVPAPAAMPSRAQSGAPAGAPGGAGSFASIMRDTLDARGATADRSARHEPAADAAHDRPATRAAHPASGDTPAVLAESALPAASGGLSRAESATAGTAASVDPALVDDAAFVEAAFAEADESGSPAASERENLVPAIAPDLIRPVGAQQTDVGVAAAASTAESTATPLSDTATALALVGVPVAGAIIGAVPALRAADVPTSATAPPTAGLEADSSAGASAALATGATTMQTAAAGSTNVTTAAVAAAAVAVTPPAVVGPTAGTAPAVVGTVVGTAAGASATAGSPVGSTPTVLAGLVPGAAAVFGAAMALATARTESGAPTAPADESTAAPATVSAPAGAILTGAPAAAPTAAASPAPAPAAPTPAAPLASQVARPLFSLAGAANGEHVITISVSPDNLGPVTVRAHVNGDAIRVELFAPTDLARDALRVILPDLRRDLSGGGLNARLDLSGNDSPAGSSADPSAERQGGRNQPDDRSGPARTAGIADADHSFRAPVFGNAHTIDILA